MEGIRKSATNIDAGFTPSNYTPAAVGSEGTTRVSSHLKGIDVKIGSLPLLRTVEAHTEGSGSPHIITDQESSKLFTNEGSTAKNYHTLPTAATGLIYMFYCQDADGIRITAGAGDTIRMVTDVSAAAGYTESTTVGSFVTLVAINATEWVAIAVGGTWTTA